MNTIKDDFRLLGMEYKSFTAIELKTAYRRRAKEVHPDKSGGNSKEFIALHAAYKRMIAYIGERIKPIEVGFTGTKKYYDPVKQEVVVETWVNGKKDYRVLRVPEKGIRGYRKSAYAENDPVVATVAGIQIRLSELVAELDKNQSGVSNGTATSGPYDNLTVEELLRRMEQVLHGTESTSSWFGIHNRKRPNF